MAPFQFSYPIGPLLPSEHIFWHDFRNEEGLECTDSESDTRHIG